MASRATKQTNKKIKKACEKQFYVQFVLYAKFHYFLNLCFEGVSSKGDHSNKNKRI